MKRELEQTLLGEMIHALFVVYECRCATCLLVENRAMNTGVSGSGGPNWRELGMKVQEVAGEMLGGEEGGGILVWGGGVGSMWRR